MMACDMCGHTGDVAGFNVSEIVIRDRQDAEEWEFELTIDTCADCYSALKERIQKLVTDLKGGSKPTS